MDSEMKYVLFSETIVSGISFGLIKIPQDSLMTAVNERCHCNGFIENTNTKWSLKVSYFFYPVFAKTKIIDLDG